MVGRCGGRGEEGGRVRGEEGGRTRAVEGVED